MPTVRKMVIGLDYGDSDHCMIIVVKQVGKTVFEVVDSCETTREDYIPDMNWFIGEYKVDEGYVFHGKAQD